MPDEELAVYQQLEDLRYEAEQNGEAFDWNQQKQLLSLPEQTPKH